MKRTILLGTLTAALLAPFAVAHAQSNVAISVNTPEFGIRIGGPVFHPVPVYAPVPVFAPAPVFVPVRVHAPRPFHVAPRVIHTAPVIVVPTRHAVRDFGPRGGVWVAPRAYQNGDRYDRYDRDDRRDGRREQRRNRDRDDYRAYNRY
jgi:hypothetical protein